MVSAMKTMIRVMKTTQQASVTVGDLGPLRGASTVLTVRSSHASVAPASTPHHAPLGTNAAREEAGGRCMQVGLFQGRFSPFPAGTSRGPRTRDTGHPPVPLLLLHPQLASLCAPGEVPGNSSISLSPPRLQETETQAPPPAPAGSWQLGPAPGAGSELGGRSGPSRTDGAEMEVGGPSECQGCARRPPPAGVVPSGSAPPAGKLQF